MAGGEKSCGFEGIKTYKLRRGGFASLIKKSGTFRTLKNTLSKVDRANKVLTYPSCVNCDYS
jgi:hypothetical protein